MKNCSHTTDCEACASNAKMAKRLSNLVDQGFDKVLAQRDEALARAEKAEAREKEIGEELDKATGMVEMHVYDAAAARLLWRQSEAACAQMHAQRDEAQQMVAELRGALADIADSEDEHGVPSSREWMQQRAQDAIDRARALKKARGES